MAPSSPISDRKSRTSISTWESTHPRHRQVHYRKNGTGKTTKLYSSQKDVHKQHYNTILHMQTPPTDSWGKTSPLRLLPGQQSHDQGTPLQILHTTHPLPTCQLPNQTWPAWFFKRSLFTSKSVCFQCSKLDWGFAVNPGVRCPKMGLDRLSRKSF